MACQLPTSACLDACQYRGIALLPILCAAQAAKKEELQKLTAQVSQLEGSASSLKADKLAMETSHSKALTSVNNEIASLKGQVPHQGLHGGHLPV